MQFAFYDRKHLAVRHLADPAYAVLNDLFLDPSLIVIFHITQLAAPAGRIIPAV